MPRVFNYDRYSEQDYQTDFWTKYRCYEDNSERMALSHLLPPAGGWAIDVGCGFGRLSGLLLKRYQQVVLFDYSESLMRKARQSFPQDNVLCILGDVYNLPFRASVFDGGIMIRVMHHLESVPLAIHGLYRVLKPNADFVLEYANKRNLVEIIRYYLKAKHLEPFAIEPSARDDLYFNFHPAYIEAFLKEEGFDITDARSVSNLRVNLLKRIFGPYALSLFDSVLQRPMARVKVSPSILLKIHSRKPMAEGKVPKIISPLQILRCPHCSGALYRTGNKIGCYSCDTIYAHKDGILDMRIK